MSQAVEVFHDLVQSRRSVRKYDQQAEFDHEAVARSLQLATLSPNSSNMQLWEFHRVISPEKKQKVAEYCMGQNAAKTASELVVFTTTHRKWKQRSQHNAALIRKTFQGRNDVAAKRAVKYYEKLIPFLYINDRFGFFGSARKLISFYMGRNKPIVREVTRHDVRACLHKSTSLAAMNFMMALHAEGYDTCAMEGFDSKRVKALLGINPNDEITMIISCGKRTDEGVYGNRERVESESVIFVH